MTKSKKSGGNEKDLWRQVAFLEIWKTADNEGPRQVQRLKWTDNLNGRDAP